SSTVQNGEPAVSAESAFAAAASAGASAGHTAPSDAAQSATTVPELSATPQAESAPHREAELAAAWQNWKQIRESFVGSQPTATASEVPTESTSKPEEPAARVQSAPAEKVAEPVEAEEAASDT